MRVQHPTTLSPHPPSTQQQQHPILHVFQFPGCVLFVSFVARPRRPRLGSSRQQPNEKNQILIKKKKILLSFLFICTTQKSINQKCLKNIQIKIIQKKLFKENFVVGRPERERHSAPRSVHLCQCDFNVCVCARVREFAYVCVVPCIFYQINQKKWKKNQKKCLNWKFVSKKNSPKAAGPRPRNTLKLHFFASPLHIYYTQLGDGPRGPRGGWFGQCSRPRTAQHTRNRALKGQTQKQDEIMLYFL